MAYQLPNGSTVNQTTAFSTAVTITGISNAVNAVATLSGTIPAGMAAGSEVLITSAWPALNNAFVRVKAVDAASKTVTLDGVDTTDLNQYPAGAGAGTIAVATQYKPLPPITDVGIGGGEQQSTSFQPLQLDRAVTLNTFKNGFTQTFTITHDSADEIRPYLEKADRSQEIVGVKFYNPRAKETRLYSAQVSFQKIPTTQPNQVETVQVVYSLQSDMKFYKDAAV